MRKEKLLKILREKGPIHFVDEYLFDQYSWYCPTQTGRDYDDIRHAMSTVFMTQPQNIALVGSAKYGFSMAPEKDFRPFSNTESDLDMVVVSKALFNSTWKHLRIAYYRGTVGVLNIYQADVFKRFFTVGTDEFRDTKYLRDLMILLMQARKASTGSLGMPQEIKIRVYSSWTDVKSYHIWSAQKLGEQHGIQ